MDNKIRNKIEKLFEYRKLPFLLKKGNYVNGCMLYENLVDLQFLIYDLDNYLESSWKINKQKLNGYWKAISANLTNLGVPIQKHDDYLQQIKKYQKHELELREGKLPTRYKLSYYYFYKSCDVKLLRRIIYDYIPQLKKEYKLSAWRNFDLVTEINDDVEDLQEDVKTINGNCFFIHLLQNTKEDTSKHFSSYLYEIDTAIEKDKALNADLYKWGKKVTQDTNKLLEGQIKNYDGKIYKKSKLYMHLAESL